MRLKPLSVKTKFWLQKSFSIFCKLSIINEVVVKSENMKQVIHICFHSRFLGFELKLDPPFGKQPIVLLQSGAFSEAINTHSECRLIRWYYVVMLRRLATTWGSYQLLEEPHKQVHDNGRKAMNQAASENIEGTIKSVKAMEDASIQVVFQIDRLMNEIIETESM